MQVKVSQKVFSGNFIQEHSYTGAICSKQDHFIWAVGRQSHVKPNRSTRRKLHSLKMVKAIPMWQMHFARFIIKCSNHLEVVSRNHSEEIEKRHKCSLQTLSWLHIMYSTVNSETITYPCIPKVGRKKHLSRVTEKRIQMWTFISVLWSSNKWDI